MPRTSCKSHLSRRRMIAATVSIVSLAPMFVPNARAVTKPRVLIVGAGVGGATVAQNIRLLAGDAIDLKLISGTQSYSPPFSIHAFATVQECAPESVDLAKVLTGTGVSVVPATATGIDTGKRTVNLQSLNASPKTLEYDILVAAPGVSLDWKTFDDVQGPRTDPLWTAGSSCRDLIDLFSSVPEGGRLAISAPSGPHRCPPAVYERACRAAHWFKERNPKATVVIIDDKDSYPLQAQFEAAFADYYDGIVEWVPKDFHGGIKSVDYKTGTVSARDETFTADVLNVVPPQTAARVLVESGLTDQSGFAPIDAATMRSTVDENVYVIGDSASVGELSKSAHAAQVEARLAACDIVHRLLHMKVEEEIQVFDKCWSTVATGDAVFMAATYQVAGTTFKTKERTTSDVGDEESQRKENARVAAGWPKQMLQETYGLK